MSGARVLLLVVVTALAGGAAYVARVAPWGSRLQAPSSPSSTFDALERSPSDASLWVRLGEEAQRDGHLPLARAAFRAAQELAPDDGTAHARLGFVLYEEGRDAEAIEELRRAREKGADRELLDFAWSMMRAHVDLEGPFPRFSETSEGDAPEANVEEHKEEHEEEDEREREPEDARADEEEIEEERERGEAEDEGEREGERDGERVEDEAPVLAGGGPLGACEIALERRSEGGIFVIDALVNGTEARLIVDTGASLTVLSRDFLDETGLRLDEDGVLTARTAAGPQRFSTAAVESVAIGERVATDIRVAICEDCGMPGSDGLLGLDVQEPLGMSLFPSRGTVRFADCWE